MGMNCAVMAQLAPGASEAPGKPPHDKPGTEKAESPDCTETIGLKGPPPVFVMTMTCWAADPTATVPKSYDATLAWAAGGGAPTTFAKRAMPKFKVPEFEKKLGLNAPVVRPAAVFTVGENSTIIWQDAPTASSGKSIVPKQFCEFTDPAKPENK